MKVLHGWKALPPCDRGASVAFGNFDGVHLGHQQVIADAALAARDLSVPLGLISFEPHARMHYQPDASAFRLMSAHQLARTVGDLGVERLYLLPFGAEMASFSDNAFASEVLAAGLGARHVAVGFDVTFGSGRTGSPDAMRRYGEELGFSVSVASALEAGGQRVSSSAIRDAVRGGKPEQATAMLGRPFAIEGVVQKGQQLGRLLGFPTANVELGEYVRPRLGVYATQTRLADGRKLPGVANIGVNPTTGVVAARMEVHLFDFDADIYGETIETELIAFQRPEEWFESKEAMVDQIRKDAGTARRILGN
jgi:riboflavin kinase/FMN adenylyltransferase